MVIMRVLLRHLGRPPHRPPPRRTVTTILPLLALAMMMMMSALSTLNVVQAATPISKSPIHVAIFSDRPLGTLVVLNSTCTNAAKPADVKFHIITRSADDIHSMRSMFHRIPACTLSTLEIIDVTTATKRLTDLGYSPFWDASSDFHAAAASIPAKEWAVVTPYRDAKHFDALNHLRFYLPHIFDLDPKSRVVFMDDDIVVQKDVAELAKYQLRKDIAMAAGCQHWKWTGGEGFVTSYDMPMLKTGYLGPVNVPCDENENDDDETALCTRPHLLTEIEALHASISHTTPTTTSSGAQQQEAPLATTTLRSTGTLEKPAFNMGLNLIDVDEWIRLGLTEQYEKWVRGNLKHKLFPPDTLAFGLVLGYLAVGKAVQCYDETITHLVGLAFVPSETLAEKYGWTPAAMRRDAFALHFNGAQKPWIVDTTEDQDGDYVDCDELGEGEEEHGGKTDKKITFESATHIWRFFCGDKNMCPPPQPKGKGTGDCFRSATTTTKDQRSFRSATKKKRRLDVASEYVSGNVGNGASGLFTATSLSLTAFISIAVSMTLSFT